MPKRVRKPGYNLWCGMKQRCYYIKNSHYKYYGARGITVCVRWRNSYDNFIEDMGHRPSKEYSLDRINSRKNYTPSNCRWATREQQGNNKTNNRNIVFRGQTKTLVQWSRYLNISLSTLHSRLGKLGWTVVKSFTTHVGARRVNK